MVEEPKLRILLLVEDNPADADLVMDMLNSSADGQRHEIHHVPTLAAAEALLAERHVDVVLLDLRLPDGSGVDSVKSILNVSRQIPIVVLTGMDDETLALACIDAGAQDYLSKEELRPITLRRAIGYSITRIREAQLRDLLEGERRQAQKMEAMGLLAGGVAHDLNNLLLVMLLSAELLRDEVGQNACSAQASELIDAIGRAQNLTRQLLTFSRKQPLQMEVLDIPDVIAGMTSLLRGSVPVTVQIEVDIAQPVWPVLADRSQIEQVLLNLAINARDAMMSTGVFSLSVANETRTDGAYVRITVSDTGSGIEPAHIERIFEPFFTTKERGRGTGLGLAMCYSIVNQFGGTIAVRSEVDVGTTFTILLPRTTSDAPQFASKLPEEEKQPLHFGRVLLVDDDRAVIRTTNAILRGAGYEVFVAENGAAALDLLSRETIDLVLSDVVMPVVSGPEMADRMSTKFPHLPVVLMTGFSEHPIARSGYENSIGKLKVLQKPFRRQELLDILREELDRARAQGG